ncbi:hypothetical protein [Pseudomonas alloputida]|uniref:hypothetical protein n=1 Tax=Pseudomonas alloputida TaxID=1940621 RepID=UPI001E562D35|nr:hypothetical protein [Pseudomonas alloputida]MCE1053848.1 hypothetical protein [Pseudomonas alloputida]
MDFSSRLNTLKKRRQGPDVSSGMAFDSADWVLKSNVAGMEGYETLAESEGVKYAVGAMSPVDSRYTQISIAEGERVAASLIKALWAEGFNAEMQLQGSVGLDVHIKGYSDVDMLVLVTDTVLVETPEIIPNDYRPAVDQRPLSEIIQDLRGRSERILPQNFPAVRVNVDGGKSISMEGGSLQRKVDIVPSAWYHPISYQQNRGDDYRRGVQILNKHDSSLIVNYPFLNRKLINDADMTVQGNIKRLVRLMKNLQSDAEGECAKHIVGLNSFDILSIAYDMRAQLVIPPYMKLGLVGILTNHLKYLIENEWYRNLIETPDQTRKVFDSDKIVALAYLYIECKDLAESLSREISPYREFDNTILMSKAIYG